MKQRNPRTSYAVDGVRGETIYAFREAVRMRGVADEGEFVSQLLEEAAMKLHGGAGPTELRVAKMRYFRELGKD